MTRRRGRRRKKLLGDLEDRRRYYHLKEEALDRTVWRNRFGRGVGSVVRQTTEREGQFFSVCVGEEYEQSIRKFAERGLD